MGWAARFRGPKSETAETRKAARYILIFGGILVLLVFAMLNFLNLGAYYNPPQYFHRLNVALVNQDNGVKMGNVTVNVGSQIMHSIINANLFDWKPVEYSLEELYHHVDQGSYWFGFYISENFTEKLMNAVFNSNQTDVYSNEIIIYYDQARQSQSNNMAILAINTLIKRLNTEVSLHILSGSFGAIDLNRAIHSALILPSPFTLINLRPLQINAYPILIYTGAFLFWVGGLFSLALFKATTEKMQMAFKIWYFIVYRYFWIFIFALFFSTVQLLVVLTMGLNHIYLGNGIYWLFSLLVCCAYFSFQNLLLTVLGRNGTIFISLLATIQLSSSNGVMAWETQSDFFLIGYPLPMTYAVMGFRYIITGSTNRIGEAVGVLFAYMIGSLVLNFFIAYWKTKKIIAKLQNESKPILLGNEKSEETESSVSKTSKGLPLGPNSTPIQNITYVSQGMDVVDAVVTIRNKWQGIDEDEGPN